MRSGPSSRVLMALLAALVASGTGAACAAGSHTSSHTGTRGRTQPGAGGPSGGPVAPIAHAGGAKVRVSPSAGTGSTRFRVAFTAPAPTGISGGKFRADAVVASHTPARGGCTAMTDVSVRVARAGERVTVTLAPPSRSRWCPGTYRGRVETLSRPVCKPGTACPQFVALLPIGHFRFTVRRG